MNHYWLRVANPYSQSIVGTANTLNAAKDMLELVEVSVLDSGLGEGGSLWFAVADPATTIKALREKLAGVNEHITHVESLDSPTEAKTLARQLTLFH